MKSKLETKSLSITKDGITIVLQVPHEVYNNLYEYTSDIENLRESYNSVVIIETEDSKQVTTNSKRY